MPTTINKRLTDITVYTAVTLANLPTAVKNNIRQIKKLNASGAGYITYSPSAGVNALTSVAPGDQITVDASNFSTPFTVDFGTAPVSGGSGASPVFSYATEANTTPVETEPIPLFGKATVAVSNVVGSGTQEYRLTTDGQANGTYGTLAALQTALANMDTTTANSGYRVQARFTSAAATVYSLTLTFTYA